MSKRSSKKWMLPTLGLGILIFAIVLTYFDKKDKNESLYNNYTFSNGRIVDVIPGGRTAGYAVFSYRLNNLDYKSDYNNGDVRVMIKNFITLSKYRWNILYDSTDYRNATLLLKLEDYKEFNIPYQGQLIVDFEKKEIIDSNGLVEKLR